MLNRKVDAAAVKAKAARETAIETADSAGEEPPDLEPLAPEAMPKRVLARNADGPSTSKTQRHFTDSDRHLMQSGGAFLQAYNCQLAVDSDHQVIVSAGARNQPPDMQHLVPKLQRMVAIAGALPAVMTMTAGYCIEDNANCSADQGMDGSIATVRVLHGQPPPPKRGPLPMDADARTRMMGKIWSKIGAAIYAQWMAIVEPVNG